ncbi:oligosaccharide flippase family protein [Streptomyces sp. NPDC051104]|uniref:lipopolysaccharide biosynthesis protein n=1 Tax=Streptomyces sp. NPDC051104 TaxID=3155044 RepID=UPI0034351B93
MSEGKGTSLVSLARQSVPPDTSAPHGKEDDLEASLLLRASLPSVLAKAVALPVSGFAALYSGHIVVGALGVSDFALFALIVTLPTLLPIGDLGVGAALVDAVEGGRGRRGDCERIECTIASGARVLTCAGMLITSGGLALVGTGAHTVLLGTASTPGAEACVAIAAVFIGCSMPLSLGSVALLAIRRAHVTVLLQAGGNVLALCLFLPLAALGAPVFCFVSAALFGQCAAGLAGLLIAGRTLRMPMLRIVVTSLRQGRPVTRIVHLAGPMTVINVAAAVTYGTDRLVLSHATNPTAVAVYSAGAQLYAPASTLVNAAVVPLWNLFVRQRRDSARVPRTELARISLWFGAGALLLGVGLVTAGPSVTSWMTHAHATASTGLMTAFAALLLVQSVVSPVGMWLTHPVDLRFLAARCVLMAVISIGLSVPLAWTFGPIGPVIASVVAHAVCVNVPCFRRVFRRA